MLKKTLTYTDYNGVERTEDFYFNITKAELVDWEFGTAGGLTTVLSRIIAEKNQPEIIRLFKTVIDRAYGVKSDDGRRFVKNNEVLSAFQQSPAYSALYMELISDDKIAADFINGIMPSDLVEQAAQNGAQSSNRQAFALA